ncbi:hypothetical protein BJV78DRAFT_955405 [Lactifluus subvellereus]|nr:hypothetical protein BJV78DRAFT_955405 [Lactifluus subvellereus]
MYLERADEEDKNMADSWKGDTDGVLVFTSLFSAAAAALPAMSIPDIRPNSQDTIAFYVVNMYQLLSHNNGINIPIPPRLSNLSSSFTPPTSAVWANGLWFLSLVTILISELQLGASVSQGDHP